MKISQHSFNLMPVVRDVIAGNRVPAQFQRPYVWSQADVLALCTSILEGFPIGGFLTWIPGKHADISKVARGRLGPMHVADVDGGVSLLLDGQNRLATLAWMSLKDEPMPTDMAPGELATWGSGHRLVADGITKSFKFVLTAEADEGFNVPAWVFVAQESVNPYLRAQRKGRWVDCDEAALDELETWVDHVRDRFREARVTETIIHDATTAQAKTAFLRICKVGVAMTAEDFDAATNWTE